jgi:hypothetical protein
MSFSRKRVILLFTLCVIVILATGCTSVIPDDSNYTVSYIRVTPSEAYVQINTSKKFEVKAYDSENNLIPINSSDVSWDFSFECPLCEDVGEIKPENGSTSTYFTPYRTGSYFVYAYYKGKYDYSPVEGI